MKESSRLWVGVTASVVVIAASPVAVALLLFRVLHVSPAIGILPIMFVAWVNTLFATNIVVPRLRRWVYRCDATVTMKGEPGARVAKGTNFGDSNGGVWTTTEECVIDNQGNGVLKLKRAEVK